MAFLYNLVRKSSSENYDTTTMWLALVIFISYLLTDPSVNNALGFDFAMSYKIYLIWAGFDFVTISFILLLFQKKSSIKHPAKLYVLFGLLVNMCFYIAMHFDVIYFNNYQPWWFWSLYTVTIIFMDLMMLLILLTNKDFLGLVKAYKWLRGQNKKASLE